MMTLMFSYIGVTITSWISPPRYLWNMIMFQTSFMFLFSVVNLLNPKGAWKWKTLSWSMSSDSISTPLIILSLWLVPVSLMASMNHLKPNSILKTRSFMFLIILIGMALIISFSSKKLIGFFMGFESSLTPTLLMISRWGVNQERMEASYYFVFYTLISSLPLFIGLLIIKFYYNHTKMPLLKMIKMESHNMILAMFCLLAFLVKVPMFGFHLWLPKAHVEAPVAGSMILAAMLLKLGGYGFIRMSWMFWEPFSTKMAPFLIPFCCWGGTLTSLICLTQTDLKSLMAYSSVSHMSFMMAGLATLTTWATSGGLMMMMAHGIVSSAMFATFKLFYERSGTRSLLMSRGLKATCTLLPVLWLLLACANLGLPPLPKAMGEMLMFSSIISHSLINWIPTLTGLTLTTMFSLSIYQLLKSGTQFNWKTNPYPFKEREMLLILLHLLPLMFIIFKPNTTTMWPT